MLSTVTLGLSVYLNGKAAADKNKILETVHQFNRGQEHLSDIEALSRYIVQFFTRLSAGSKGALFLYSHQENQLHLSASLGLAKPENFMPLSLGNNISEWTSPSPSSLPDLAASSDWLAFDKAFPDFRNHLQKEGFTYLLPLIERRLLLGFIALQHFGKPLAKDLPEPLLSACGHALESLYLYESAVTDETTGLFNKRFFQQSLQTEIRRSERYRQPFSLIAFDIDDFKKINDTYGHPQGDLVLKELAGCLKNSIRESLDIPARTGGEEFHVVLPETDSDSAFKAAERIRTDILHHPFSGLPEEQTVTISLGIATYPDDASQAAELVSLADKALYQAKSKGKNQTCRMEPPLKEAQNTRGISLAEVNR